MRTVLESWRQEEAQTKQSSQGRASGPIIDTPPLDLSKTEQERQREVERALRLVDAAMKKAEGQLTHIPNLPSARLRRKVNPSLHDMHQYSLPKHSLMPLVRCTTRHPDHDAKSPCPVVLIHKEGLLTATPVDK